MPDQDHRPATGPVTVPEALANHATAAGSAPTTHQVAQVETAQVETATDGRRSRNEESVVLTVSRVLHGYRWWQHENDTVDALTQQLQVMAAERGLRLHEVLPALTSIAETGAWARITQTATARLP